VAQSAPSFDPTRHLRRVRGGDYLEVKWRLVWLRDQYPDATIETELIAHDGTQAIFRALVTIPTGASATGWGSETVSGFENYIEKAETKAIGRALAALGFGTQFCEDFDYGDDRGQVVDAPVARERSAVEPTPMAPIRRASSELKASEKQLKMLADLGRAQRVPIDELAQARFSRDVAELDRAQASNLITELQSRAPQREKAS